MSDSYTEVSSQSWGSRIGGSIKGVFFGIVLVLIAAVLLFWNEGRAVKRRKALEEGAGLVVSVAAVQVDPANEGKLVHMTGEATTDEVLRDADFGVGVNAIRLDRKVEMYQWQETSKSETKKKLGGGTETVTTYEYNKGWAPGLQNSSNFKKPEGHQNPGSMPWQSDSMVASNVRLGAYRLSPSLVGSIGGSQQLPVDTLDNLPESLEGRAFLEYGGIYVGTSPAAPEIGDVRVTWSVVRPTVVSIVSQQRGDSFEPYTTSNGQSVELLRTGTASADAMFKAAQKSNVVMTWILRLVGFVLMLSGFGSILKPLSVLADVVPFIGNLVGAGTGLVSTLLSAVISFVIIAVAWLFYRPLLGISVLVLALAALVGLVMLVRKAKARRGATAGAAAPAPAPPPPPAPAQG